MSDAPENVERAFLAASAAVGSIVQRLDPGELRSVFGENIGAWLRTRQSVQNLWAAAWATWNTQPEQWYRAARVMQRALTEAIALRDSIADEATRRMTDQAFRIFWNSTPLRHVTQANQTLERAQDALSEAGIPRVGVPVWVKVGALLAAAAVVVYLVRR